MTDQDVRDLLERMATEASIPFADVQLLTKRALRRAARTVVVGAVGVAAAIAVLFAGASQLRGAPPNGPASPGPPTVSPSRTAFTDRFDSPLNGLSIGYPSGWKTRAATEPWGGTIAFDAPDVDVIFEPKLKEDLYLAVVSEPLGSTSPGAWILDHYDHQGPSMGVCSSGGAGGIGNGFQGNPAWFQDCYEPHGEGGHIVLFATATRGYVIYIHVPDQPQSPQQTRYARWFDRMLRTVVLSEDPLDTVNPSGSP